MSKNSANLSDRHYATHDLSSATLKIGVLDGEQLGVRLSWQEVERLVAFIEEEQLSYREGGDDL